MQDRISVEKAAKHLAGALPPGFRPEAAVILGTGLGDVADGLAPVLSADYRDIPGFPESTVPGHAGRLLAGVLRGRPVLVWQGRFHLYEGYTPGQVCMGVRVSALLGARTLIVTNVAGALDPKYNAGGLLAIVDHVNLTGQSPLTGPNEDSWGPRFPDMSRVYSPRLLRIAQECAMKLGQRLELGVYAGVAGPQLETPAETRFLRAIGADAVGMSTVMEAIAAKHMGLEVLGLSCLVNKNLPDCMAEVSIEEVLSVARSSGGNLSRLLFEILEKLDA
ncbi:purine-nucleoside phosphorylase [Fundidesulfovibrio agrisoli]|uniref:purine-nucleoside phosphorylase n=1 Tax=Fundidesulfovibrio agrisoli TaxID=2922717 RepID=UPI001FAD7C0F|nr:purine-nucleoside phosphorylase [Fundidesulfovibrio agrisoli]